MSAPDAGTVLVQRLVNFMNFHHEIGKRAIEMKVPYASDEFPAEKRQEVVDYLMALAVKAHENGLEMIKSIPPALVFQLIQTNMMNSLDRCEEIMNAELETRELLIKHIQAIGAEKDPNPILLSSLVTVNECGTDEELHKMRRYLQCFVETTVGSDLAAARKRFEENKEYYLKQRETARSLLPENVRSGHLGLDGDGLHEGGAGEGAGGDGEGRAEEEGGEGKGKEKEGEAEFEGEPSSGHDLGADHARSEGAAGERVSTSGCGHSICSYDEGCCEKTGSSA
jgi:hypothetical protein